MSTLAVLGGQWGDEGKGKIIDALSREYDCAARFQGGSNAGHTVVVKNEQIILHQIPSGILHENVECILGNGMVIDPIGLNKEIEELRKKSIYTEERIHISHLANVITPLHKALDAASEKSLGKNAIGTTKRGIGPCYVDKVNRSGFRFIDFKNPLAVKEKLEEKLSDSIVRKIIPASEKEKLLGEFDLFYEASEKSLPMVSDTFSLIHKYIEERKKILIEGAQGTLLDVDFGSYPYVTSSNTISGNICIGLGISPFEIDNILGIFKAYTTRVGAGPFPTEQNNKIGKQLKERGNEYGATTGRPRRCGWFDAALGKFSVQLNGFTSIAVTKLDVLDEFEEIKICTHYENGHYPYINLYDTKPHYITVPGWQQSISDIREFLDLPENAKRYLKILEDLLSVSISYVSVGGERDQIIKL
jgi:adenylosuccinate synthase